MKKVSKAKVNYRKHERTIMSRNERRASKLETNSEEKTCYNCGKVDDCDEEKSRLCINHDEWEKR